jgi:hypothetical protein
MRRFTFLVIVAALVALAVFYARRGWKQTSDAVVTELLPRETIAFAQVPDFNRTRDQWHQSDVYQLYREPTVQDFLQKPLARLPNRNATAQTLQEIERLDPKDGFLALISIENNNPKFAAGFRFRGRREDAEPIIGKWRSQLLPGNAKQEPVQYQQHKIDIVGLAPNQVATVYDGRWFFASNDLAQLKAIVDRVDRRAKDRNTALEGDDALRAAMAHMPSNYALLFYLQPKTFSQKLASLRAAIGQQIPANQRTLLEQTRSVCAATRFEHGKIREVIFAGMPKLEQDGKLTRSSVTIGTKDTFVYFASLLNLGQQFDALNQAGAGTGAVAPLQKIIQAFLVKGVTADDWKGAFGPELDGVADWPANARWPSLLLTLPVKDEPKATKVITALMGADEDARWRQSSKDGVRYFSMQSPVSFLAMSPTIALSNRILIAGFDAALVEAALKRSGTPASELSNSQTYQTAARSLPEPTNFFAFIDSSLLYSRLDAVLRPILLMSAAFMPAISDRVDINKLPPPELITKHLSPIVASQRYEGDGYVAESIGPITMDQAVIVLGLPLTFWATAHWRGHAPQ